MLANFSENSKMATSAETLCPEKSNPADDWTVVLPRRGKRNRTFQRSMTPKLQREVHIWAPTDLENNSERESKLMQKMEICIKKLENSEFSNSFFTQMQTPLVNGKFMKVLGSEKKMQMVIYGIGSIDSFEPPRLQLSLAILMKKKFDWIGEIEVFDPVISLTESKVIESLGCSVLSVNEQGRREVVKPTLFFMPHCEAELYDNLLAANWPLDRLTRLLVFGNSFCAYEEHYSVCNSLSLLHKRKYILSVRRFTDELEIKPFSDEYFKAFHGSSWHFFNPADEVDLTVMNGDEILKL